MGGWQDINVGFHSFEAAVDGPRSLVVEEQESEHLIGFEPGALDASVVFERSEIKEHFATESKGHREIFRFVSGS